MNKTFDFVIIGSGMGGLVSACILAKEGYSVLVLEKNHQIGGNLQVFSRDKRIFDTGVHYIGSLDEGENLHQFFTYLEIMQHLNLKRLDDDCFDLLQFPDGKTYKYAQGYDGFKANLYSYFPEEKEAIDLFCTKIKEICNYFPFYNLESSSDENYFTNPEILEINAFEYINSLTSNERLKNVLAGNNLLYAGVKEKTPLYVLALILNSNLCGSYRMVNGSSQIAIQLSKVIRKYGGKILNHKEVVSANYNESGLISEVVTKDNSVYKAKNFISNIHPALTIPIFGQDRFIKAYSKRILSLENTQSCFLMQLSLKENTLPYFNHNIYQYYSDDVWEAVNYKGKNWPKSMYISAGYSSKNSKHLDVLTVMVYMSYNEVEKWKESINTVYNKNGRGESYLEFKKEKEEIILSKIEDIFPNIRSKIIGIYSSTPLTYKDYIGSFEGSTYGILKNSNKPIATIINPRTKIANLFLTGQNLIFHGILGTTVGGFVTCFEFLDKNKIIEKIKSTQYEKL
jgi:all-trans-retinol 13,14-reductase